MDNCGESDLDFEKDTNITNYVSQVESSIVFVKSRNFETIDLIGTSYGGMVVLVTAMNQKIIRKVFLRAPMLDWKSNFIKKRGKEKLIEWKEKGYMERYKSDGRVLKNLYDSIENTEQYRMDLLLRKQLRRKL